MHRFVSAATVRLPRPMAGASQTVPVWAQLAASALLAMASLCTRGPCAAQDVSPQTSATLRSTLHASISVPRSPRTESSRRAAMASVPASPHAHDTGRIRRTDADYSLAFLVGVGAPGLLVSLGYLPLLASGTLSERQSLWIPVGVASAGALAAVAVLWAAPFGRRDARYRLRAGLTSISLQANF